MIAAEERPIPRSTAAQLRDDIDSGRTGDKVPWSDPAAAPLGTDAVAAGTPPSPAVIDATRREERRDLPADRLARGTGGASRTPIWPILVILVVMVLLAVLALTLG